MKRSDLLHVETDDACAMCGIRGNKILTEHHIDGNHSHNEYDNLILLCYNCHQGFHERGEPSEQQVKDRKRNLIFKILTQYGLNAMKIADRQGGVIALPFLLYHLVQLGYMEQQETQMTYGGQIATANFSITREGRELLKKWFS
jgi:predicted restriction endonuclease